MSRLKAFSAWIAATCLLILSTQGVRADEIEHKWRIGFSAGGYSITDQQHSGSANVRALLADDGRVVQFLQDPRNDSGAFSDFGLEPQYGGVLSASYGITRLLYFEGSLGYRRGNVGNVQMQAMFTGIPVTDQNPNNYTIININGGTVTQIPVEFTLGLRFRPKAAFNPYLCLGVGYSFNAFKPSKELDDLSLNLEGSIGAFARFSGVTNENPSPTSYAGFSGITVDAPSAPEWHVGGGLEYTFSRKWTVFLDARYTTYSGKFEMKINGSDNLGISVPNDQILQSDPSAVGPFGGYFVTPGLVDAGRWVPTPGSGVDQSQCHFNAVGCEFQVGSPDGLKDPGLYYIQAGRVRYDAASYQIGFKYTF